MADGTDAGRLRREALRAMKDAARSTVSAAAEKVGATGKGAVEATREKIDDGYRAVTFAEHRQHVEETLDEVAEVLVAFDARLTAIERRLDEADHR